MKRPKITPIAASPWTDQLPHEISDHDKLVHQAFLQAGGLGDGHGFGERCKKVLKEEAYASISLEDVLRHWTGYWHRKGESLHPLHTQMQQVFKSLDDFKATGDPRKLKTMEHRLTTLWNMLERELGLHEEQKYIINEFVYAPELLAERGKSLQAKED